MKGEGEAQPVGDMETPEQRAEVALRGAFLGPAAVLEAIYRSRVAYEIRNATEASEEARRQAAQQINALAFELAALRAKLERLRALLPKICLELDNIELLAKVREALADKGTEDSNAT